MTQHKMIHIQKLYEELPKMDGFKEIHKTYKCSKCGLILQTARDDNPDDNYFLIYWNGDDIVQIIRDEKHYIWDCDLMNIAQVHEVQT